MNNPKVSIIFPTYNGWQDTKKCLESILNLGYPKNKLEIIVIDNASVDDTPDKLKEYIQKYSQRIVWRLIENRANLGFAKAVNKGLRKAKGDYLLITNNDVIFEPDYLATLVEFIQKHPLVGIVGGKVYYKKTCLPAGRPKNKIAFGGARFDFYTGILKPHKNPNKSSETDWAPGCNMLVRRQVLEKIGLFDEKFFFYFEDLDLCLRVRKAGYKVIYSPRATMYHGEGASIKREDKAKNSQFYYEGKTRILFKHASKLQLLSSLVFQFTFGLAYQFFILKHQNYTPAIKALVHIFASQPPKNHQTSKLSQTSITLLPQNLPSVTIVFPTLNGKSLVAQVLDSIKKQNYPEEKIEVIVIDNGSNDGTPQIISHQFPWVRLIRLKKNTGSAPPITMGAKIAKGDYILATNDDVVFEKNCLIELVKTVLSDNRIGIVTGKMMTPQSHKPLFFGFRINPYLGYHPYDFSGTKKIRECDWAPGACILVKKSLMAQVGYFDDKYIFCGDDHDFCYQIRSIGYKIVYTPKAIYYHSFTRTEGEKGPSQANLYAHFRGKFRFMIKNANILQMLTFFPIQVIFGPFYSYFRFGHKTFLPILQALVWNIQHLSETLDSKAKAQKRRKALTFKT